MKAHFSCGFHPWAVCVVLAVFLTHIHAAEDDTLHALQALETALHDEAATPRTSPARGQEADDEESAFTGRRGDIAANWAAQLRAYLEQGESEQVERLLSEISAISKSEAVLTACKHLREEVHRERDIKEQSVLKHYRDAAANAENAVKSARVPADLDAALHELSGAGDTRDYQATRAVQEAASHVQSLRRYVILWQDYLASRQHGDNQTAMEKLRNISQEGSAEIFPRSEILARIEELKTSQQVSVVDRTGEILGKLKTPDQIAEVVRELQVFQAHLGNDYSSNSARTNLGNIIGELQSYAEIYNTYQTGLPTSVESLTNHYGATQQQPPAEVQNLKAELLRLLCARQFSVEARFKPNADEPIPDYLDRLLADARERGDARMIMRVREMQRQTSPRTGSYTVPTSTEATGALQAIMAAQNQEEAGQFIPAVVSYENALKNGSDVVPAKAIGARLDAIKSAHPTEYEKGMQISLGAASGAGAGGIQPK